MEVDSTLKDINTLYGIIKSLDGSAIPLMLAFLIPAFYLAIKKLAAPAPVGGVALGPIDRLLSLFSVPAMESWVIFLSTLLLIVGIVSIKIGLNKKEEVRRLGIKVKSYYTEYNYYSLGLDTLNALLDEESELLVDLPIEYPNEFITIPNIEWRNSKTEKGTDTSIKFIRSSLILTDSLTLTRILNKSSKLLDTYLTRIHPAGIDSNSAVYFQTLFSGNNFFTNRVCYKLISDSSHKYVLAKNNGANPSIASNPFYKIK